MIRVFLEDSLGMLFIGFTLATWLFGVNTLQIYTYFQKYNDGLLLKTVIIIVFISDMLNTIFGCWGIYLEFVPAPLVPLHGNVPMVLESTASDVAIFIVQCFFAQSIYQVSRHNKWLTGLIVVLAVLAFASGIALTAASIMALHLPGKTMPMLNQILFAFALGLVTLTDVVITISLVWYLFDGKSSAKRVSHLLDRLILYCVQRGILTTVSHAIVLLLWYCLPTVWAWTLVQLSLGKVFTLTFLILLNRRESLKGFRDRCYDQSDIKFEVATNKVSTLCRDDETSDANGTNDMVPVVQSVV